MIPVKSSMLSAIGHDGTHLTVRFPSGKEYVHENVPAAVHTALMAAPSVGKAYIEMIKGKYPHKV